MQTNSKAIRIQKYLADQGICSRRVAEGHIKEGMVSVNGKTAELGAKIEPGVDRVSFNGKPVHFRTPAKLTVCINKPKGFICSNDDPHNDRTVFDLLPKEFANQRLFCAGRLDKDSEGLQPPSKRLQASCQSQMPKRFFQSSKKLRSQPSTQHAPCMVHFKTFHHQNNANSIVITNSSTLAEKPSASSIHKAYPGT